MALAPRNRRLAIGVEQRLRTLVLQQFHQHHLRARSILPLHSVPQLFVREGVHIVEEENSNELVAAWSGHDEPKGEQRKMRRLQETGTHRNTRKRHNQNQQSCECIFAILQQELELDEIRKHPSTARLANRSKLLPYDKIGWLWSCTQLHGEMSERGQSLDLLILHPGKPIREKQSSSV